MGEDAGIRKSISPARGSEATEVQRSWEGLLRKNVYSAVTFGLKQEVDMQTTERRKWGGGGGIFIMICIGKSSCSAVAMHLGLRDYRDNSRHGRECALRRTYSDPGTFGEGPGWLCCGVESVRTGSLEPRP